MSDLRRQLESAKREHAAAKYQGDLAADVLTAPMRIGPLKIGLWAAGAIAASVVMALLVRQPEQTQSTSPIAQTPTDDPTIAAVEANENETTTEIATVTIADVASLPAPSGIEFSPALPDAAFPSMPSFPSMEAMIQQSQQMNSTSTTQESV